MQKSGASMGAPVALKLQAPDHLQKLAARNRCGFNESL